MKASRMLIATLKETPNEAVISSHVLLLRAGMIRKLVAGVYNYLPLGLRVLNKVEKIVREEMDNSGALEILSSAIQPKELWEESKTKLAYANRKYRIAKCDKQTGEIIKIYEIIKDILDENPEYYLQAIRGCCQGTKNSYKGFRWHYCDLETSELILKGKFAIDK